MVLNPVIDFQGSQTWRLSRRHILHGWSHPARSILRWTKANALFVLDDWNDLIAKCILQHRYGKLLLCLHGFWPDSLYCTQIYESDSDQGQNCFCVMIRLHLSTPFKWFKDPFTSPTSLTAGNSHVHCTAALKKQAFI